MRRLPRFAITISVLLAGCTEGASLVQPGSACGVKDVYSDPVSGSLASPSEGTGVRPGPVAQREPPE